MSVPCELLCVILGRRCYTIILMWTTLGIIWIVVCSHQQHQASAASDCIPGLLRQPCVRETPNVPFAWEPISLHKIGVPSQVQNSSSYATMILSWMSSAWWRSYYKILRRCRGINLLQYRIVWICAVLIFSHWCAIFLYLATTKYIQKNASWDISIVNGVSEFSLLKNLASHVFMNLWVSHFASIHILMCWYS